jgi:hypothetical protein
MGWMERMESAKDITDIRTVAKAHALIILCCRPAGRVAKILVY